MKKNNTPNFSFQVILNRLKAYGNYLIVLIIIFLMFSLVRNIAKTRESLKTIEDKKNQISSLEEKNKLLRENLEKVQSQDFIEKQIRDQLGLAKSGEIVLVLPEDEILKKLVPELPEEEDELPDPIWKKWYKLFF